MGDASSAAVRRTELAARQAFVAAILAETQTDQLVIFEPANISWFSGSPLARGIQDPNEQPALIVSTTQRWVVCSNVDSRRLFDTFLDDMGFQLKEWPWHVGRDQLLADLCDNKKLSCDRLIQDATSVATQLKSARLIHSPRCQDILRELGRDLAHSLEATGRAADVGIPERELAGQIEHRLAHRGIEPVIIHVAADGRDAFDFRPAFTERPCQRSCLLSVVGRRDGLHVAASRTIWFGDDDDSSIRMREYAGQIAAARQAALIPGATPETIFIAGQRVAEALEREHAWRDCPFGTWTGWLPVETTMSPTGTETLTAGHVVTLTIRIETASYLDTFLLTESGAERITCDLEGPVRRFRIAGQVMELPDVLRR